MSDTPRMKAAQMAAIEHGTGNVYRVGCDIERELNAAQQRIKRLEHEIELFREHADYGDKCLIEAILKGEAIGRKAKESKPCIYCMKVECVCSDFDISSNMGAQG